MSVINKMMQDLDQRGAAPQRVKIPLESSGSARYAAGASWTRKAGWFLLAPAAIAAWFGYNAWTKAPAVTPKVTPPLQQPAAVVPKPSPVVAEAPRTPEEAPVAERAPAKSDVVTLKQVVPTIPKPALENATPAPRADVVTPKVPAVVTADVTARDKREPEVTLKPAPERAVAVAPKVAIEKAAEVPVAAPRQQPIAVTVQAPVARPATPTEQAEGNISIERQDKSLSRTDQVTAEYRSAVDLMKQGRAELAFDALGRTLRLDPRHVAARQAMASFLLERGRAPELQRVLREGIAVVPENTAWPMLLARLQVETGDAAGALDTLEKALPHAKNRPDYHAFVGTVLQMLSRHNDAIAHYEIAVRMVPESGRWLTGLGISLSEEKRYPEARAVFRRALATNKLGEDLQVFVERKLNQMQ